MKLGLLIILIPLPLAAAGHGSKQRRAGSLIPLPPDTTSNTNPDTTALTTATTPSDPSGSPGSVNPTGAPSGSTSSSDQSASTGLPTISGPSLSIPSSSSTTSQPTSSSSDPLLTVTVTSPSDNTSTPSSSSATPSNTSGGDANSSNTSVGTGTIIGLSVAGGIAALGAIAFIIWKLTRKRFSEFDADGEEIKWPELGPESHALPTRPTGRVGVDDDGYDDARMDGAGRHMSNYAASSSIGEVSTGDLHSYNDPYAVPPLPHLDPNQPYHDDPSNYGGHYDPYHGPVPPSFHDAASADRLSNRSPAPVNYGRQSPGPSISYTRTGY